jgi:hypothetical protein
MQVFVDDVEWLADARPDALDPSAPEATIRISLRNAPFRSNPSTLIRLIVWNATRTMASRPVSIAWPPGE